MYCNVYMYWYSLSPTVDSCTQDCVTPFFNDILGTAAHMYVVYWHMYK